MIEHAICILARIVSFTASPYNSDPSHDRVEGIGECVVPDTLSLARVGERCSLATLRSLRFLLSLSPSVFLSLCRFYPSVRFHNFLRVVPE